MTLKPARRCGVSLSSRLTTNPDCTRRVSTLQSAHKPVRGHLPALCSALSEVAELARAELGVEEAADSRVWGEERPHPPRTAGASMARRESVVIEFER